MTFTLRIFESEFKGIKDFVLGYTNIETGGDLFGLWKANGDPVVQLIIGPGQKCRRTSVSFHQDTDYLARVGTYVNTSFMLCHIGSWHSHHQLSLTQPSTGDRSTVCNNFPEGLKRYIMIIANISRGGSSRQSVVIHPYMFTRGGHVCNQGSVEIIPERSPFREVGYVVNCIASGAERVSTDEAYTSRAPLGYHNRPSTRSKPTSQTTGNFETNPTNRRSHSPMKVDSNLGQPSKVMHGHDQQSNPMHQNYFSTNDVAGRPSPMDVDPPENHRVAHQQPSNWSRYQVNDSWKGPQGHMYNTSLTTHVNNGETNEAKQWYESEEGGTILKEIIQEITTTMTSDIDYHRDTRSMNLTMEFRHDGQKWMIVFPKSFGNEPAVIKNQIDGKGVPSKNIIKDIRKACKCAQCQVNKHNRPPSPSRGYHPPSSPKRNPLPSPLKRDPSPSNAKRNPPPSHSRRSPPPPITRDPPPSPSKRDRQPSQPYTTERPQTGRGAKSPPQPWYNTASGKAIVERIKSEIDSYLRSTSNSGKVKTLDKYASKELTFYHFSHEWIVELANNPSKDVKLKFYGSTTSLGPPYDIVSELKKHCPCTECRSTRPSPSGQRRPARPNSRYAEINYRSPSRVSSTPSPKFFASEEGEKQFEKIYTDFNLLSEKDVKISRLINSKDIEVTFEHYRRQWKIRFPFKFPERLPEICYGYIYTRQSVNQFIPVTFSNGNVLRAIRKTCKCSSCERYHKSAY